MFVKVNGSRSRPIGSTLAIVSPIAGRVERDTLPSRKETISAIEYCIQTHAFPTHAKLEVYSGRFPTRSSLRLVLQTPLCSFLIYVSLVELHSFHRVQTVDRNVLWSRYMSFRGIRVAPPTYRTSGATMWLFWGRIHDSGHFGNKGQPVSSCK